MTDSEPRPQPQEASGAALRPLCVFCGSAATHSQSYTTRRTRTTTRYHRCAVCGGVFLDAACRVSPAAEKARYDEHNNSLADPRNRAYFEEFLGALLAALDAQGIGEQTRARWRVLDFGSGPSPSLVQLMREQRAFASAVGWDLYYSAGAPQLAEDPLVLRELGDQQFDLVTAQEVVEHFVDPLRGWQKLAGAVRSGGYAAVATYLLPDDGSDGFGSFVALPRARPCTAPEGDSDDGGDIAVVRPREAEEAAAVAAAIKRARTERGAVVTTATSAATPAAEDETAREEEEGLREMRDGACMPAKFETWAYRRDPTHVSFYTLASLKFVADCVGLDFVCSPGTHKFLFRKR